MQKVVILLICLSVISSCNDKSNNNSVPIDLNSCFSPEFGASEAEQFYFNTQIGELKVNLNGNITRNNPGYSIQEGQKTVFVYRHFLQNSFNILDDEAEVRILFEIEEDLISFDINSNQDFEDSNCIYSECGIALQTISGKIEGSKVSDGNWYVNANLKIQRFNQEIMVTIDDVFKF